MTEVDYDSEVQKRISREADAMVAEHRARFWEKTIWFAFLCLAAIGSLYALVKFVKWAWDH